jgi:hypothetical protein
MVLVLVAVAIVTGPRLHAVDSFNQEYTTTGNTSSVTDAVNETGKAGNAYLQLVFRIGVGAVIVALVVLGGWRMKDGNLQAGLFPFLGIGAMILILALSEKYLLA